MAWAVPETLPPIAVARERAGISVPELAGAIGINEQSCWDLMEHEDEICNTLSLQQLLCAATALHVSPLALVPESIAAARERRTFPELARCIRKYCADNGMSTEQFSVLAGWDVGSVLEAPSSAYGDWCLDCLRDVCTTLSLHWPDFVYEE